MDALQAPYMTSIYDIVTLLAATMLALVSITNIVMTATTQLRRLWPRSTVALIFDMVVFQAVFDDCSAKVMGRMPVSASGRLLYSLETAAEISLIIVLLALAIYRFFSLMRLQKRSITFFSVGEALEDLPMGVLFASPTGQILQTNRLMEELNLELTGTALMNGNEFWEKIRDLAMSDGTSEEKGKDPVIRTADGRTWIFSKTLCHSTVTDFYQILASDATEERILSDEAYENVRRLEQMNRRLQDYNHIVDDTVRKEELLEAKKRVHDNMGTVLIAAKMMISNEQSPVTPGELLDQWRKDLTLLREEAREGEQGQSDPFERFRDVAKFLGIDLQIMGRFPKSYYATDLIAVGIQECMTNAISHADATQMYVTITEEEYEYVATYSNNGKEVSLPVQEGGGLSLLRSHAEKAGATMEYLPSQHFCLALHIPKYRR